jgi:hypothetical protein
MRSCHSERSEESPKHCHAGLAPRTLHLLRGVGRHPGHRDVKLNIKLTIRGTGWWPFPGHHEKV